MNAPFRVAFVGGSIQSAIGLVHNVAIRMDRRFHLVAGCFSRNDEVNRQTGYEWGVAERTYSRFTEMLQSERSQLDAVVILTPVFSHAEVITAALVSGLAVVSEKPLVSNLGEIQKIKDALVQSECPLFVTFNYTGYPMIRELRARIARGDLGRIHSIRATMQQEGYLRRTHSGEVIAPQSWRLDDRDIPTVSLDLGAHVINLQNFLMRSKPIQIASRMNSFGAFPNVVDDVDVMYYTENGCFVHGWWGKSSLGYPNGLSIEVFGSEGSAKWIQMDPSWNPRLLSCWRQAIQSI
jgi:predicted dehydrogenase